MGVARRITARDSHTVPNARDEERQRHRTPIGAMPGSSFGERDTGLIGTGSPTGRADSAEVKPGEMNWWRANNPGAKEENLLGSRQGPSDEVEDDAAAAAAIMLPLRGLRRLPGCRTAAASAAALRVVELRHADAGAAAQSGR